MKIEKYELFVKENVKFEAELRQDCGTMINFIVESNGYAGHGPIYLNIEKVKEAITILSNMLNSSKGKIDLQDIESADYYITMNFLGPSLRIEGCIGDYNEHRLYFGFIADQTVLKLFLEVLKNMQLGE